MSSSTTNADSPAPPMSSETAIEHAKRAFALKKYEQAVEYYATALELVSHSLGEDSPEIADLYFAYGKALLENAISQSSVLGKEQQEEELPEDSKASASNGKGPILSFSGDAEDAVEDTAVDLFAEAAKQVAEADAVAAAEEEEEDDDEENAEPEDDFNAAWEVLDLARAIYDKQHDADTSNEAVALKLADCYITLGDVSLETEKFDQAVTDYEVGLTLKTRFLPVSSRQIAEAHYKLSIVLDLTPGRLSDSITHAGKALESIQSRLEELESAKANPSTAKAEEARPDPKGKGKASAVAPPADDAVQNMSVTQIEGEIKELKGLKGDLAAKIEELKSAPNDALAASAPVLVAQALDKELGARPSASSPSTAVVNDLTNMVRKKKAPAPSGSSAESTTVDALSAKRKADDGEDSGSEKKPKLDTDTS
ncbi:hypothetical protein GYMLUDRAFT_243309 [Collybiopsis luxurians FD-317 M1]|uniref:Tetratricopeptide SHNi-TPR domain-containing protein n=1 Tax=Collybiopsis luxurians FD-317 M1 TaxID=944289 RepID=A0A0D0CG77_9AGAR|nr:hypothetical protein GYMLUDRAFT_243309 [Collybiopsis luxurians FD-317 M1]